MFDSPETAFLSTSKGVLKLNLPDRMALLLPGTEELSVNQVNKNDDRYYISTRDGLYISIFPKTGPMEVRFRCLEGKMYYRPMWIWKSQNTDRYPGCRSV